VVNSDSADLSYRISHKFVNFAEKVRYYANTGFTAPIFTELTTTQQFFVRNGMLKAAFNNKRDLFTSKMDLELRKKLVRCYIWSIMLKLGRFGQ
jgi:hypothetical protein